MPKSIIKGDELMIFLNGKSLAQATSHTMSTTLSMQEVSSKDYGRFAAKTPQKLETEIQAESLFTKESFKTLQDAQMTMTPVVCYFGFAQNNTGEGLPAGEDFFDFDNTKQFSYLDCYISSLSVTAASGDNATFSATFTGAGPVKRGGTA